MKANKDVIVPLSDNEVKQLLNLYSNNSVMGCRNKTILMLMLDCGLRLGEVVNLKIHDVDFNNRYLVINGKGSKQRVVPFGSSSLNQIKCYLNYLSSSSSASSSLFLTQKSTPVTRNTIKMLFARIKKNKGLERVYPHLLRHTFATNFIFNGGNLEVLRLLLGHSTINITQIYIHLAAQKHLISDMQHSNIDLLMDEKREQIK